MAEVTVRLLMLWMVRSSHSAGSPDHDHDERSPYRLQIKLMTSSNAVIRSAAPTCWGLACRRVAEISVSYSFYAV